MSNPKDTSKNHTKVEKSDQFSDNGVYVREDDQDWGSSGMNDIQRDTN